MLQKLIYLSIHNRAIVLGLAAILFFIGLHNAQLLPIDAVPDITNVQVQVNSFSAGLSTLDVERQITIPIENALNGIPNLERIRSLSKYGFSQVSVVFNDGTDIFLSRQLVNEKLAAIGNNLPTGLAAPTLDPISTGLGQIFFWSIEADDSARKIDGNTYSLMDLRTIQDWVVKPRMKTVPGVAEINFVGGFTKQYQVLPKSEFLVARGLSFKDVATAIQNSNVFVAGGYIEHQGEQYTVSGDSTLKTTHDIENISVISQDGIPILVKDVADVQVGVGLRNGAATHNGHETVLGIGMMMKGANSREVSQNLETRLSEIRGELPEGVTLTPLYNRSKLVNATISTVEKNLIEGALLVVVILFLLLGSFRAALIVSLTIPLAMLFAVSGMIVEQISANLLSLGAIDFGIIVDGAVVMTENILRRYALEKTRLKRKLTLNERLQEAYIGASEVAAPTLAGVVIIMIVYLPILTLEGIEGKMFVPMSKVVLLALTGALILALTFTPAMVALFVKDTEPEGRGIMHRINGSYAHLLKFALKRQNATLLGALFFFAVSLILTFRLGSEFIPRLDEKDFVIEFFRAPSISLTTSVKIQKLMEERLKAFPEIKDTFSKCGTDDIGSDPDSPNVGDTFVMLKPIAEWPDPSKTKEQLISEVESALSDIPGDSIVISQPIQLRMDDLIAGAKGDVAIKIFGDDLDILRSQADIISEVVKGVKGAKDVEVEQLTPNRYVDLKLKRTILAHLGIPNSDVYSTVEMALGGKNVGKIYEGDKSFDLTVRLAEDIRQDLSKLKELPVPLPVQNLTGNIAVGPVPTTSNSYAPKFIPLGEVAEISYQQMYNEVSREDGKRRAIIHLNIKGRDLGSFVEEAINKVKREVRLPSGYWVNWGGEFEHLQNAKERLMVVVPISLFLILFILFLTFNSFLDTFLIISGIPFALTGGIVALYLRGIPFSISAGIGLIALSGVAVLNGVVLISYIRKSEVSEQSMTEIVENAAKSRLRAILMTALVASVGFLPMAIATGTGAEVQRPLATVVIGGIISSTTLTLILLPLLLILISKFKGVIKT